MAVIGTFGSFTAARLGIYASQASLNVTGNNIANINTKGYTRQRMDLVSLYSGGADRYSNMFNMNVGYGVLCSGVSQLRDPYLDIRFRNEQASLGEQEAKLSGLTDLSAILDEVGKGDYDFGIIENQLNDFKSQLQNLTGKIGSEEYDTLVRSSAATLVKLFNTAAQELDVQYDNKVDKLKTDIRDVNTILKNIQDLNEQIRNASLYGDKALELRDTRNVLIDELSSYMKIDVTYTTEKIDQYSEVEKIMINLADTSPAINLVDGIYVTQVMMPEELPKLNPDYNPDDPKGMQFLDWKGNPTDNPREAAPMWNQDDRIYLDKDGKPTNVLADAALKPNPNVNDRYLTANGLTTDDPALAARAVNPTFGFKYLDPDGNGTNIAADAEQVGGQPKENPGMNDRWLKDGGGTTNTEADAAPKPNPDVGTLKYLTKDGKPTADPLLAAPLMNDTGNSSLTKPYLVWDPNATYAPDDPNSNLPDFDNNGGAWVPVANIEDSTPQKNPDYDETHIPGMKYLYTDANGKLVPTDDKNLADKEKVPNALEGAKDENKYLLQLAALTDSKGRPRRDEHNRFIDEVVDLSDTTLKGSLQAVRELLTEEGEFASEDDLKFDGKAATKRGIPYYEKTLDFLAKSFAEAFNKANQMDPGVIYQSTTDANDGINYFVDGDGKYIEDANGRRIPSNATKTDPNNPADKTEYYVDSKGEFILDKAGAKIPLNKDVQVDREYLLSKGATLKPEYDYYDGGVLFSNNGASNDTTGIDARNISISKGWGETTVRLLNTKEPNIVGNSTKGSNIKHMINLMNEKVTYYTDEVVEDAAHGKYFVGTFQEMYRNISTTLGDDRRTTTILYNNFDGEVLNLENQRQSVSGVDLNEEATNMMQFQKSYAAACRLLTTIDSMLDKLINGTAI